MSMKKSFVAQSQWVKKIVVLDLGFLGDTIHLLPALWMIHQNYPHAKIDVVVSTQVTSLFDVVPWINRAWAYMRYPRHATFLENIQFIRDMRREKYDLLINLNGSDRSYFLSYFMGAKISLGKISEKTRWLRKNIFDETVHYVTNEKPVYLQSCEALKKVGIKYHKPKFHIKVLPQHFTMTGLSTKDQYQYIHISPFTTLDSKELSFEQMNDLMNGLHQGWPQKKIIFTCGPNQREINKMKQLVNFLDVKPWKIFPGTLKLPALVALMKYASLHLSGDTGTVHIARMLNIYSVSWFRDLKISKAWIPDNQNSKVFAPKILSHNMEKVEIPDLMKMIKALVPKKAN